MASIQSPSSFVDFGAIFDDFINKDCLLSDVPNTLDSEETTSLPPQERQPHLQELSPPATPKANGAPAIGTHPHPHPTLKFSESHFLATETTDLPIWKDPSDLFNFDLATPDAMLVKDLLAATDEGIPQILATLAEPIPSNPTTDYPLQAPTQYSVLPPTPFSLPSTTTSPAPIVPPPPPPSTVHSVLTPTLTTTTPPPTTAIPTSRPRQKKTFPCTSPHCHPTATTQNSETTHHHHHKDPKHRFCCRYEACTSCTSYTTRKDRNRHEASKHSEQHLVCDVCGHTTAREDNMRVHVRAAHREGWEVIMKRIMGVRMRMVMGFR